VPSPPYNDIIACQLFIFLFIYVKQIKMGTDNLVVITPWDCKNADHNVKAKYKPIRISKQGPDPF